MSDASGPLRRPARAYLLEVAVIVSSILLAFALDRGYDAVRDRREERIALEGLRSDFLKNRAEVEVQLSGIRLSAAAIRQVLEAISSPELSRDTLSWEAASGLFASNTLDTYTATLDQLESSAKMELLRDGLLRSLLSEWLAASEDARNEQLRFVDLMGSSLWPALADEGYAFGFGAEGDLPAPRPQRPVGAALGTLRTDALLRQMAIRNGLAHQDLEEARDATEAVLARLDLLLGR